MGLIDGIIGSGISAATDVYVNKKNLEFQQQANEQNIQLQRDINQQNLYQQWKMWEATNNYNSPVEQMARYREAGLNPNLIYGQSNTAQAMNVGTAQSSQVHSKNVDFSKFASVASTYLDLISKKKVIEKQQIENNIAGATYDDVVKQSGLTTQHLEKMLNRADKEIEQIGLENTYKSYENQLKSFEVDMLPLVKQLKQNELSLSNSQVDLIPVIKLRAKADLKLANITIGLNHVKTALLNAQTKHELKKIGVTEQQKQKLIQDIKESEERVKKIKVDTDAAKDNKEWTAWQRDRLGSLGSGMFGDMGRFIKSIEEMWRPETNWRNFKN